MKKPLGSLLTVARAPATELVPASAARSRWQFHRRKVTSRQTPSFVSTFVYGRIQFSFVSYPTSEDAGSVSCVPHHAPTGGRVPWTEILLICLYAPGAVLVMVLYWTYYIRCVRKEPRSEDWYDESAWDGSVSDGVLFIYPYCSLIVGVAGAAGLVASANPPEFCEHGAEGCVRGSTRHRRYWIYGSGRGSASVAFCSALGR